MTNRTKLIVYVDTDPKSKDPRYRSKTSAKKAVSELLKAGLADGKIVVRTETEDY